MTDHTSKFQSSDISTARTIACIAYLPFLFFLPIVAEPGSKFGRFHANQSLIALIILIIGQITAQIIGWLPFIGGLGNIIAGVTGLIWLIFMLFGIFSAYNETAKELPIIGGVITILRWE